MPDEVLSARESIEKAFAEVPAEIEAVETPEAVVEEAPEEASVETAEDTRARDELGRFKAAEAAAEAALEPAPLAPVVDAPKVETDAPPARFMAEAKAAWATTPPAVRAEINRSFAEMERGLQLHQQTIAPLKQFIDMAGGSDQLAAAAQRYIGIEQMLAQDPLKGLDTIARNLGTDLRTIAAHVMGQPAPDQNVELQQLRQQNQQMAQQLQGVQAEKTRAAEQQVTKFVEGHPRFGELSNVIAWTLKTGLAADLPSAYEYADRLKPALVSPGPPAPTAAPAPQTRGPVSIKGAPSSGSNPGRAAESMSTRDAVARAFSELGGLR
jgi:hypothetical protein